jgi:hypothetical protein
MHKCATKCNETIDKWCKNKHGAWKIIDTLETYQPASSTILSHDSPPGFPPWDKLHVSTGGGHCSHVPTVWQPHARAWWWQSSRDPRDLLWPSARTPADDRWPYPDTLCRITRTSQCMSAWALSCIKGDNLVMPTYLCMSAPSYQSMSAKPWQSMSAKPYVGHASLSQPIILPLRQ